MIYIKIHESYRNVVALCDSELLGKRFEEGIRQLHLKENFYKGLEITKEEAIEKIKEQMLEDSTFNIVGKEAINSAIEAELTKKEDIDKIQSIPFILTLI